MNPLATLRSSGLLFVHKPSGPSSYDMIRWIKRHLKDVKIGHSGTLDPLASGLMIILLGKATKLQSQFMGLDKVYRCRMRLGVKTDSGDITGNVLQEGPVLPVSPIDIERVFKNFVGEVKQTPPMYSALKHEGTPLYKLARRGIEVDRPERTITIHSLVFLDILSPTDIVFRVHCSSGTYVRSLVEEFGAALGACATVVELVRESIGRFSLDQAISGESLKTMTADEVWAKALNPEGVQ